MTGESQSLFRRLATDILLLGICLALLPAFRAAEAPGRPKILWISSEDHGPQKGCYGDTFASTPKVDQSSPRGE